MNHEELFALMQRLDEKVTTIGEKVHSIETAFTRFEAKYEGRYEITKTKITVIGSIAIAITTALTTIIAKWF